MSDKINDGTVPCTICGVQLPVSTSCNCGVAGLPKLEIPYRQGRVLPDPRPMTLRQHYAAHAVMNFHLHGESPARAADWAFSIADAMIAFEKAEQR